MEIEPKQFHLQVGEIASGTADPLPTRCLLFFPCFNIAIHHLLKKNSNHENMNDA